MADIRSLVPVGWGADARLVANAGAPAGLTAGKAYWPVAFGIDCAPAAPVMYVLLGDDNGALRAFACALFVATGLPA